MEKNGFPQEEVISVENVSFTYGDDMILDDLSLDVYRGETLVILGGSGAGKSTLLRLIMGLIRPTRGRICVLGQDITQLSEKQLRPVRKSLGFVFQGGALFDSLTVAENVAYPIKEYNPKVDEHELKETVRQTLAYVHMENFMDVRPSELSGGQKKRIAIARAVVTKPEIILYDEPTTGLDPIVARRINDLINQLREEKNITSIVVTHIMQDAFAIANRLVMMKDGKMVFEGHADQLMLSEDPYIQQFVR